MDKQKGGAMVWECGNCGWHNIGHQGTCSGCVMLGAEVIGLRDYEDVGALVARLWRMIKQQENKRK